MLLAVDLHPELDFSHLVLELVASLTNLCVLSRFDLIYLILDKADEQTDRRLAKHIVALHSENPEVV